MLSYRVTDSLRSSTAAPSQALLCRLSRTSRGHLLLPSRVPRRLRRPPSQLQSQQPSPRQQPSLRQQPSPPQQPSPRQRLRPSQPPRMRQSLRHLPRRQSLRWQQQVPSRARWPPQLRQTAAARAGLHRREPGSTTGAPARRQVGWQLACPTDCLGRAQAGWFAEEAMWQAAAQQTCWQARPCWGVQAGC